MTSELRGARRARATLLGDGFHSSRQRYGKDQPGSIKIMIRGDGEGDGQRAPRSDLRLVGSKANGEP